MTTERCLKLTIEYDGTDFHGWQRQPGARTVEGTIEDALAGLVPGGVAVQGASRTDQGVHALGQVASALVQSPIPTARFARALNGRLPPDVRVREVEEAPPEFNARFSASGKHYRYWIDRREVPGVLTSRYALHVPGPLDVDAMNEAGARFAGEHDFSSYECASHGPPRDPVRMVHVVRVVDAGAGDFLAIDVLGRSFLYKMVRTMVGTLLEVGQGKRTPAQILETLHSRSRSAAGPTAPPQGLFLVSVSYPGLPSMDGASSEAAPGSPAPDVVALDRACRTLAPPGPPPAH